MPIRTVAPTAPVSSSLQASLPATAALPFDLLVHPDAEVRASSLRALLARRDPETFTILCAGEAIDEAMRQRDGLPPAPLSWRRWAGMVPGAILAMPADERLVWALEFAGKLIAPQRFPELLIGAPTVRAVRSAA